MPWRIKGGITELVFHARNPNRTPSIYIWMNQYGFIWIIAKSKWIWWSQAQEHRSKCQTWRQRTSRRQPKQQRIALENIPQWKPRKCVVFLRTMCLFQRMHHVLSKEDSVFFSYEDNVTSFSQEDNVSFPTRTMCRVQRAQTKIFSPSFGPTELIIGPSRAKNCEEVDDEVHFWLELPKPDQKDQKWFPRPKQSRRKNLFAENWFDGDRLKRVLAKSRGDRSHVWGKTRVDTSKSLRGHA